MNKRRTPFTVEHAVTQVISRLGPDGFEEATGRSWSLATKWSDPDNNARPSPEQIIQLEIAYRKHGGRGSPILDAMRWRIDREAQESPSDDRDYRDRFVDLHGEVGRFSDTYQRALADNVVTADENRDILNRAIAARAEFDDVIRHAEDALTVASAGRAA